MPNCVFQKLLILKQLPRAPVTDARRCGNLAPVVSASKNSTPTVALLPGGMAGVRPVYLSATVSSGSAASRADLFCLSLKLYTIFVDKGNNFPLQRPFDDLEAGK